MQPYTIGTSNNDRNKKGNAMISIEHNNRKPEAVAQSNNYDRMNGRPAHIDVTKSHLNSYLIQCENELDAYEKTFGESVERFNTQQKRKDRRTTVEAELDKVRKNEKMQPLYEMIVQIGNQDYYPNPEVCEKILKRYLEEFQAKFPNIKIVNATLHMDEATPHLHLVYIPFKTKEGQLKLQKEKFEKLNPDNKEAFKPKQWKGMDMQPGLTAALEEMGYTNDATITYEDEKGEMITRQDYDNGALAQWQKDFNGLLEKLCIKEGIPFHHPQAGKNVQHKETQEYKEDQIIHDKLKEEIKEKEAVIEESDAIVKMNESIIYQQDEQISQKQEILNELLDNISKSKEELVEVKKEVTDTNAILTKFNKLINDFYYITVPVLNACITKAEMAINGIKEALKPKLEAKLQSPRENAQKGLKQANSIISKMNEEIVFGKGNHASYNKMKKATEDFEKANTTIRTSALEMANIINNFDFEEEEDFER